MDHSLKYKIPNMITNCLVCDKEIKRSTNVNSITTIRRVTDVTCSRRCAKVYNRIACYIRHKKLKGSVKQEIIEMLDTIDSGCANTDPMWFASMECCKDEIIAFLSGKTTLKGGNEKNGCII